jgi:hypothetical protein
MSELARPDMTLADLLPAPPQPGAELSPARAFVIDRAARDRLVIFDPTSAPLIRPLIMGADLRPWHAALADRWAIAIPAGYTAGLTPGAADEAAAFAALAARHPALARQLEPHAAAAYARPGHGDHWWEITAAAPSPPGPRILLAGGAVAWDESGALLAAPILSLPGAEPYVLALLWAFSLRVSATDTPGPALLELPAPAAPAPLRASLSGLALSAANLARQLAEQERAVLRRLLADFAPPGAAAGPRLARWWELEFHELRAELRDTLHNDIPERFRQTWEQIHAQQRADHTAAAEQITQIERAIDSQVAALAVR